MYKSEANIVILFFLVVAMALSPFWGLGFFSALDSTSRKDLAAAAAEFLSPSDFFDSIKQNFSIFPLDNRASSSQQRKEGISQYPSSKIQEINRSMEEETGVNLPKFLRWCARSIGSFFSLFGDLLKKIGGGR